MRDVEMLGFLILSGCQTGLVDLFLVPGWLVDSCTARIYWHLIVQTDLNEVSSSDNRTPQHSTNWQLVNWLQIIQ